MMPRIKTKPQVDRERIQRERYSRVNPIRNFTARRLISFIENWDAGNLSDLARVFAAIERRDENIATVAPSRYNAVARLPWDICINEGEQENPDAARQRAALVYFYNNIKATDVMRQDVRGGLSAVLMMAASAIGHEYAVQEVVWQPQDPIWETRNNAPIVKRGLAAEFRAVPLWFFEARNCKLRYLRTLGTTDGEEMVDGEWFVSVGRGLLLASAINYLLQRQSINDWARFNKDFGQPLVDAMTKAAKGTADWEGLRDDLLELFSARAMLHGPGTEVTYTSAGSGQATYDLYLERLERRVLRMWTGGDLATKAGTADTVGASLQKTSQDTILEADAEWLSSQLNTSVDRWVLSWWFGPEVAASPLAYFKAMPPPRQNVVAELKKDEKIIGWGGKIKLGALAERYGRNVENGDEYAQQTAKFFGATGDQQPFENESPIDRETRSVLASAIAAANMPLAERLDVLLAMKDETAFAIDLAAMLNDAPDLAKKIVNSSAIQTAARAQANGIAAHLLNALTDGQRRPAQ